MEKRKNKNTLTIVSIIFLILLIINTTVSYAQEGNQNNGRMEQELVSLSKQKWQWMADRDINSLDDLFHEKVVFVHMGATMNKEQEINTIKGGGIQYKNTEIKETSVRIIGNTAIVLEKIRLTAIVGGNEVINPFMVTEVYIKSEDKWKLVSLSFTRLLEN